MPIWSMTCCQSRVEPSFFSPASSCSLILMMRFAILSTYHTEIFSWDSTRLASSASLQTTVKPPTRSPMFLRTAQASLSMSPLAKP
uniref:Uncharacterized protein n=1 Tax=Gadus morhua TaxID=8049 RepID=A0A8C5CUJ5_GADMO